MQKGTEKVINTLPQWSFWKIIRNNINVKYALCTKKQQALVSKLEDFSVHRQVMSSIPSKGTYLSCYFHLWLDAYGKQPIGVSLSLSFSLPASFFPL